MKKLNEDINRIQKLAGMTESSSSRDAWQAILFKLQEALDIAQDADHYFIAKAIDELIKDFK